MSQLSDQVGRVVGGRYRLLAPLGAGSSAQVFLADDVTLQRQVAVKMLQPALAADERFLQRFRAEAQAAAEPDQVVVSGETYSLVRADFVFERLGFRGNRDDCNRAGMIPTTRMENLLFSRPMYPPGASPAVRQ